MPSPGTAEVAGIDVARHPDRVRRVIGFVAQKPVADPMDTGRENLVLAGRLQGMRGGDARSRAAELLARFSLDEAADRLVKTYSGGMARKLDVAIGLMNRPQVLFLDEPTTGLDPEARAEMWAELEAMAKVERMTVLLTTHYLEEADRLASRLAIVDHGRVVVTGSPEQLKDGLHGDAVIVELAATPARMPPRALRLLERLPGLDEVLVDGRVLRSRAASGAEALPQVLAALDERAARRRVRHRRAGPASTTSTCATPATATRPHGHAIAAAEGPRMTTLTAPVVHTGLLTARQLRAFARNPAYLIINLIQPIIWLLLFGQLFKSVVDIPGFTGGDDYLIFLTPGIVMMMALFGSAWAGTTYIQDMDRGVMDRFLTSPTSRGGLIVATMLYQAVLTVHPDPRRARRRVAGRCALRGRSRAASWSCCSRRCC